MTAVSAGLGHGATFTVKIPMSVVQHPPALPRRNDYAEQSVRSPADVNESRSATFVCWWWTTTSRAGSSPDWSLSMRGPRHAQFPRRLRRWRCSKSGCRTCWSPISRCRRKTASACCGEHAAPRCSVAGDFPVLALTAYGRPEDRVRILAAGFNMHPAKPADPTELVLAVASLSGRTG